MDDQNKNLILATVLSFLVILIWFTLFPPPTPEADPNAPAVTQTAEGTAPAAPAVTTEAAPALDTAAAAVAAAPRIPIDTPRLEGSLSLLGGRIDDLSLKDYKVSLDEGAADVRLLAPVGGTDRMPTAPTTPCMAGCPRAGSTRPLFRMPAPSGHLKAARRWRPVNR